MFRIYGEFCFHPEVCVVVLYTGMLLAFCEFISFDGFPNISLFRRTHRESFFSSLFLQRSWPTYSRPRPSRPSPDLVSPPRVPSWASTLQEAATPPQPGCSVDDHRHWQRGRPHPNPRGPCAVRPWAAVLPNRVPCSYENPYSIPPRAWAAVAGLPWPRWERRWPRYKMTVITDLPLFV
jgi:hypothetical protein